jgi:glutathione S-transferase
MPADFAADRGTLYFGSGYDLAAIEAALPEILAKLRAQLGWMEARLATGREFMLGAQPGLPDALCYYLVWFIRGRYSMGPAFLAQFEHLCAWEQRVKAIGHGRPVDMTASEALDIANQARPATPERVDPGDPQGLRPGAVVEVVAEQVEGAPPVAGRLLSVDAQEIAVLREDPRVGEVAVHFPRVGYRVVRR